MPKKPHKKKSTYHVAARIDEAHHPKSSFEIGDRVKILPISPKWPSVVTGTIRSFTHGNFGKGRINAVISCDDGHSRTEPLGRLRKL